jgi:very-short-patch-repair endonuclease
MRRISDTRRRRSAAPDVVIAALAARQHGVVSLTQLVDAGLSARAAQHRVRAGRLHRVHRAVYAVGHALLTPDGARMAAVLACGPGAVLSHRTAAAAWGLRATARSRTEVLVTRRAGEGLAGIEAHRVPDLAPDDVTELRGIPITTVARTLLDLAGVLGPDALERAVQQAAFLRLLDARALTAAIDRAPNRRGVGTLRAVLDEPDPGHTRSRLEERFLALCRRARLPLPRLNVHVPLGDHLVEVDALWPRERLIVELDGAAAHRTARAFHADRRRDAALIACGYVVVRLTWPRVTTEPADVVCELRQILARRGMPD